MDYFQEKLKNKMDSYVHFVYQISRDFPKEEQFGVTSQLRRSALSVILNYIEGFARQSKKANLSFLNISYGSLKESKYPLYFCFCEKYVKESDYKIALKSSEEIGAMLWSTIEALRSEE
jgi:four helix bundle protein